MLMYLVCIIHGKSQYTIIGLMCSLPNGIFTWGFVAGTYEGT